MVSVKLYSICEIIKWIPGQDNSELSKARGIEDQTVWLAQAMTDD